MAKKVAPQSLRAFVQQITEQLTALVTVEVERRVAASMASVRAQAKAPVGTTRREVRLCPVPGCGKAGAGPRNRYFCSAHSKALSKEEQLSILARSQRLEWAEQK